MALRTRAKETVQVEFREVNASGVFLAQTEANQKNSMSLLQQNGFRPLTYQEAIVKIDQNPELKEQLKGKWFYLDGKGSQLSGYYTFNDKGELTQGKGDIEKTVYVWKGSQPLSLYVRTDVDARDLVRRFLLSAYLEPSVVASVVVGVRTGHEVATPKIEVAQTEEGVKLTGVTTEQLMALQRDSAQELSKVADAFGSEALPKTRMLVEALRIKE
jgi:hypothetical protein